MLHNYVTLFVVAAVGIILGIVLQVGNMRSLMKRGSFNWGLVALTFISFIVGVVSLILAIIGVVKYG
jgi:hypothetical protein